MFDGAGRKIINIIKWNKSPYAGKPFPVVDTENRKKDGRQKDDSDRTPAVKRMQQTHGGFLMFKRASFHNRAAQYFNQTTSDSIDNNTDQNADKRIRKKIR